MPGKILIVAEGYRSDTMLGGEYSLIEAKNGPEALAILAHRAEIVSAIVIDISTSLTDGRGLIQSIRENFVWAQIPIIVTCDHIRESVLEILSLGAINFLPQPYDPALLAAMVTNCLRLKETATMTNTMLCDKLTGLYTREVFFELVRKMVLAHEPGYYVMASFDIDRFKVINDQYGTQRGDEVLRYIAEVFQEGFAAHGGICCHVAGDDFAVLYPASFQDAPELTEIRRKAASVEGLISPVSFSVGRYVIHDLSLSPSAMYDRAVLAANSIKGRYDAEIAVYDDSLLDRLLLEQQIVSEMKTALAEKQFEAWFQPQYNHSTNALIGAEALVRWRHPLKGLIAPNIFISIFEQNGFIYELDKFVWEEVCRYLRYWLDEELDPLPISVNISRHDLFHEDFLNVITGLVKKYRLPVSLLRLEITESAFTESAGQIIAVVKELIDFGFIVEIDDFGSGYSSLNTLKDVPAQILKLDMRFLESVSDSQRGGNIVESIVRMAKWLNMSVIAEGVEEIEQADFLKSIGCNYVQGYLYARPMPVDNYEELCANLGKEEHLLALETVENLNHSTFWNPKSMDTLIFNTYVGGACIFEYYNHKIEIIRANDKYARIIGGEGCTAEYALGMDWEDHMDEEAAAATEDAIRRAIETGDEATYEAAYYGLYGAERTWLRTTFRLIARTGERYLLYSTNENVTAQRLAEQKERQATEQLQAVMKSANGGISVMKVDDGIDAKVAFANDRYYSMFGYTREQFQAEIGSPLNLILPEDRHIGAGAIEKIVGDHMPCEHAYRCLKRDGSIIYVRASKSIANIEGYGDNMVISVITDISELVEAEQFATKASAQLQAIIANVNGGVTAAIIENERPYLIFRNAKYIEQLGYSEEQFAAEAPDLFSLIHPADRDQVVADTIRASGEFQPFTCTYRIIRRDGQIRWMQSNISMITLPETGDKPVQLAVASDITDLMESQQREHSMAEQMQAIMSNVDLGITAVVIRDETVEYLFSNDKYYEILGYTREQFAAEVEDPYMTIAPEDRQRAKTDIMEIIHSGEAAARDYRALRRDGSIIWLRLLISVSRYLNLDEPVQLTMYRDITAERYAGLRERSTSERMQAVMDNVNCGITAIIYNGQEVEYLMINDRYYELLGYTREEYHALPAFSPIIAQDRQRAMEASRQAYASGMPAIIECRVMRRDGSIIWLRDSISMTRFEGVEQPVQLSVFTDISEEIQSALILRATDEQLRFLNETAHQLLTQSDEDASIHAMLRKLMEYFNSNRAYIYELDNEKAIVVNTYEVCAEGVSAEKDNLQDIPLTLMDFWLKAFEENGYYSIEDVYGLDDSRAAEREHLLAQGIRSFFVVPMYREGQLIGMIGVDDPGRQLTQIERLIALSDYLVVMLTRRDLNARINSDNKMMASIMNDMPGGFARIRMYSDGNLRPVYLNEGLSKLTGMSNDELMAIYANDAMAGVHPEDIQVVEAVIAQMLANGQAHSSRYRIMHKDYGYIWLTIFGRMSKDLRGDIYLNIYYTDASEQVKEEEKQRELLDNLPCGAGLYEYDGNTLAIVHLNKRYLEMVGRKRTDNPLEAVHPDDRLMLRRELEAAIEQGRDYACNLRILYGIDQYRLFNVIGRIIVRKSGVRAIYSAFTPISEEEMSFRESLPLVLNAIMESSTDLSFAKDRELRYICGSRAFAKMAGVENERSLIGKTDFEIFPPAIAEKFRADDITLMNEGKPLIDMVEQLPSDAEITRYFNTSKYPLRDAYGNIIGLYGVGRDITKALETDSQLKLLTDSIPGGLIAYEVTPPDNLRLSFFNVGICRLFGMTEQEYAEACASGDPLGRIFDEDRPLLMAKVRELLENDTPIIMRYRIHVQGGGYRWISPHCSLVKRPGEKAILNVALFDVTEEEEAIERLRISEEEYRLAMKHSGNIVCRYNIAARSIIIPADIAARFSLPEIEEDVDSKPIRLGLVAAASAEAYTEFFASIHRGEETATVAFQYNCKGEWRWMEATSSTVFSDSGQPVKAVIAFLDITERIEKETAYRRWQQSMQNKAPESYSLFRCNLIQNSSLGTMEGKLLPVEFSRPSLDLDQRTLEFAERCVMTEDREKYIAFLYADRLLANYYRGQRLDRLEYRGIMADGSIRWIRLTVDLVEYPNSTDVEAYLMFDDIDQQKNAELQAKMIAEADPLTGVLNRKAFSDKVDDLIRQSKPGVQHGFFMLDLDGFKLLNDVLGHGAGDDALVEIAKTMQSLLRRGDLVGRYGGDEFVIFLNDIVNEANVAKKASQICDSLRRTYSNAVKVSVSIGISIYPRDGADCKSLYEKADTALYIAKDAGRDTYKFYNSQA